MKSFLRQHWDSLTGYTGIAAAITLHNINDIIVLLIGISTLSLTTVRLYIALKRAKKITVESEPPFDI